MKYSTWEAEALALRAEIARLHDDHAAEIATLEQDVRQVRARCKRLNDAIGRAGKMLDVALPYNARDILRNAFNEAG